MEGEQYSKTAFLKLKDHGMPGKPEIWVVDYGKVDCGGSSRNFCGSAGCLTQVFILRSSGQYEKIFDDNVRGLKITRINGQPAMTLTLHGSACGLVGSDVCIKTVGLGQRMH